MRLLIFEQAFDCWYLAIVLNGLYACVIISE